MSTFDIVTTIIFGALILLAQVGYYLQRRLIEKSNARNMASNREMVEERHFGKEEDDDGKKWR